MERGVVHATFTAPSSGAKDHYEAVIWVVGCRAHYVRWEIALSERKEKCCADGCCHHVSIHDQPDYVVHWYDHFYCARPCMGAVVHLDDGK
jgi:hypothetical protein